MIVRDVKVNQTTGKVMELLNSTAVLIDDRYVGCYYNVDGGYIRVFNREGNTTLVYDLSGVYEWLGYLEAYKPLTTDADTKFRGYFAQWQDAQES